MTVSLMGAWSYPLSHGVAIARPQPCRALGPCLSDAAHLTCRGARQGEFSGVCCCAIEAFFLALHPLGRLCARPSTLL